MKNRVLKRVFLVCMGLLIGFALAEVVLRVHSVMAARRVPSKVYAQAPGLPGTIRMAVLGGSTSAGTPYSDVMPESGFNLLSITRFLLEHRYRYQHVEIDNYSGANWSAETTVNHYFERPGSRPDVLILYSGQNETTRYYSPNMVPPPAYLSPLAKTQFGSLILRRLFTRQVAPADQRYTGQFFSDNVIPAYEREYNVERYRRYVERMIRHAAAEGICLVVVIPQSNYLLPPTRSIYRGPADRKAEALQLFKQAWQARYFEDAPERAQALLEQLSGFCSFADLSYELGQLHYSRGQFDKALSYLRRARDTDGFPTSITSPYRDVLQELVSEYSVPHVDMDEVIREGLGRPIPDYASFLDDCHLSLDVCLELSREIIQAMREKGFDNLALSPTEFVISDTEWAEQFGITPLVQEDVLALEADYHEGQAGYMFSKMRVLRKAWSYLQRIKGDKTVYENSWLAEKLTETDRALRAEDARMRSWIHHEGPLPIGLSAGDAPEAGFGREAEIEASQGDVFLENGEAELAVRHYRAALAVDPDLVRVRINLAVALHGVNRIQEAIEELEGALELDPKNISLRVSLSSLMFSLKRFADAAPHMREAVRMSPGNEGILSNYCMVASSLAWQLSTDPVLLVRDGDRAVMLAEEVCRIRGYESFEALDTLAAAYAESDRFEEAVSTAEKALALAMRHGSPDATAIEKRSAEYKAGRPWRSQRRSD